MNVISDFVMESKENEKIPDEYEEKKDEKEAEKKIIRCPVCKDPIYFSELNTHMRDNHPKEWVRLTYKRAEGKRKSISEEDIEAGILDRPTYELTPDEIRAIISVEGKDGLNKLKRMRLEEVLSKHPRITSKLREFILFQWDTNEMVRDNPEYFWSMLRDSGVDSSVAKSITEAVWSLEWKYASILQEVGITPRYWVKYEQAPSHHYPLIINQPTYPHQPQYQPILTTPPTQPTTMQPYPPQPYFWGQPTQQLTKEDIINIVRTVVEERLKKDRIEMLQEEVSNLKDALEDLSSMISEMKQQPQVPKDEALTLKKIDELQEKLRETEKRIFEVQREYDKKLYEKDVEILRRQLEEVNRRFDEVKKSLTETVYAAKLEGYRTDSYRLLSEGLEKLSERKPLEQIARMLFPETYKPPAPSKETTIPESDIEELKKRGLVK